MLLTQEFVAGQNDSNGKQHLRIELVRWNLLMVRCYFQFREFSMVLKVYGCSAKFRTSSLNSEKSKRGTSKLFRASKKIKTVEDSRN